MGAHVGTWGDGVCVMVGFCERMVNDGSVFVV